MAKTNKKRHSRGWLALFIPLALFDLGLLIFNLIDGKNIALFHAKGLIAQEQRELIVFAVVILLVATIPTLFILYFTAWKYRESNTRAVHDPLARQSPFVAGMMWLIPLAFLVAMAPVLWSSTHRLEPNKIIAADTKPITIQVVAMRWKWVFLYPEQKIATVNFVQIPKDTPVTFELTADETPMSSFWIPNLGGQLYAMTSHVNKLNLIGETVGDYPGSTPEINGSGFAGMKFTARVSSVNDFDAWVQGVKQSNNELTSSRYADLLKPSENNSVALYSDYQGDIYSKVFEKYMGGHMSHTDQTSHEGHK